MRALLTPDIAPRSGTVVFRPGRELLPLFRHEKLLITPVPEFLRECPVGRLADGEQQILDDLSLSEFWINERVIGAAGGKYSLRDWTHDLAKCQFPTDDYHHFEFTTLDTKNGPVCLCYSHDNEFRDNYTPDSLNEMARHNCAMWIVERIAADLSLSPGREISHAELALWTVIKGISEALPESVCRRILKMPQQEDLTWPQKESSIVPEIAGTELIVAQTEKANKVLKLEVDPESPQSFMRKPKRVRWVNPKYTRWVKEQPCSCCGKAADDPHHIIGHGQGGIGTKAHDLFVIPLCRQHHDALHADMNKFEDQYGSQLELLLRFIDHAIAVGVIG